MEGVVRHESIEETTAEMGAPEAPKEHIRYGQPRYKNDTGHIGCRTQTSEAERSASPSELQHQSEIDMVPPSSPRASFPAAVSQDGSGGSAEKAGSPPHPPEDPTADLDCLICCNPYSLSRLPKLLACHHVFCAVCLKLLLQNEDHAWSIVCPVCRKATAVFGGLVCSLPNREGLLGCGTNSGPSPEVLFSLDTPGGLQRVPRVFYIHQEDDVHNQVATKRLLFLLLLLLLLTILALPFVYSGLLKWALCLAVILGTAMAGVLCFNPTWSCSCSDVSFLSWPKRESHITSIA
ncbi:E3 ubiquitin-protein ligase RNF186-like [Hemicordylus capensis]|uniref:E3 ubiquitin-protein ligase RNF186-like n=1 Tax=Hemicordylus capensis TaxID=884348 RepID=UPI002303622B|nr:E3 ubiquitin-protein ligase RNF186-like [Hemicordylus capensis]